MRKFLIIILVMSMFLFSVQPVFATTNPHVTIVNPVPGAVIYSSHLLVSVKTTEPSTIRVSVTNQVVTVNGVETSVTLEQYQAITDRSQISSVQVGTAQTFTSQNNLSFHAKRLDNIPPGIYRVTVHTLDEGGNIIHTNARSLELRSRPESVTPAPAAEAQNTGATHFLTNLLRAIFRD